LKKLQNVNAAQQQAADTAMMERDALTVELNQGNGQWHASAACGLIVTDFHLPLPPLLITETARRLEESAKVVQVSSFGTSADLHAALPFFGSWSRLSYGCSRLRKRN
jgi:hypothetical protein